MRLTTTFGQPHFYIYALLFEYSINSFLLNLVMNQSSWIEVNVFTFKLNEGDIWGERENLGGGNSLPLFLPSTSS